MSKINFVIPTRYDKTLARAGKWVSVRDEVQNHYGDFLVRFYNHSDSDFKLLATRLSNEFEALIEADPSKQADLGRKMFVEFAILDWKLNDGDGEPIPFTKEAALEYLEIPEIGELVFEKLFAVSKNPLNFQPTAEATAKK